MKGFDRNELVEVIRKDLNNIAHLVILITHPSRVSAGPVNSQKFMREEKGRRSGNDFGPLYLANYVKNNRNVARTLRNSRVPSISQKVGLGSTGLSDHLVCSVRDPSQQPGTNHGGDEKGGPGEHWGVYSSTFHDGQGYSDADLK